VPIIILVRHAQPVVDPSSPSERWVLSEEGRTATARLAEEMAAYKPARLLCGTEPKMQGTAEVLSDRLHLPVIALAGLSEHARRSTKFGDTATFEASINALFARPGEIVYGEESGDMTHARFIAALEPHCTDASGPVIAVSGGTAISLFLSRRTGVDAFVIWKRLRLPMAFVIEDRRIVREI
jgi:broad specificity phosphatase PhoE